jgi:GNAT superfamily N-acetyltransferase
MRPRDLALAAVHASAAKRLHGMDCEAFIRSLEDWAVEPIRVNGEIVGAIMINGPEIHVEVIRKGRGRWLSRRLIRSVLGRVMAEHGYALTRVNHGEEWGHEFVGRLGFEPMEVNATQTIYRMQMDS